MRRFWLPAVVMLLLSSQAFALHDHVRGVGQRGAGDGSVGDSYDNALAETINGLYKAEVIHRRSWPNRDAVELATLEWVDWFNHKRLLGPLGNIPPAEAEAIYYQQTRELAEAA